jgi:hypothetical protein
MTPEYVAKQIEDLKSLVGLKDGTAHEVEDAIYLEVLKSIASGTCPDPAGCAREALKSRDMRFPRWFE